MMKTLIITEKPSVARDIVKALGTFENKRDFFENNRYVVTWALGHLVTLYEPSDYDEKFKKWDIKDLPIIPTDFKLKPISKNKTRFNIIKRLVQRKDIDILVNACDAGREGELIFRNILALIPHKGKRLKRLWLSAMTKEEVRKGFSSLKDESEYDLLGKSATLRMVSDWLIGINSTRAISVKYGDIMSVGRVQTPTLYMIYNRDKEIYNFKSEKYFVIEAYFQNKEFLYKGIYQTENKIKNKKLAEEIAKDTQKAGKGIVQDIVVKKHNQLHPLLYDLTELQRDANKKFGYSAQQTLNIAQKLYEQRKMISYPRTDSRYIPQSIVSSLGNVLKSLAQINSYAPFVNHILSNDIHLTSRVVDDKGVSDHYALIPTGKTDQFGNLTPSELNIFDLIVKRFLCVFYPPEILENMKIKTLVKNYLYLSRFNRVVKAGWAEIYGVKEDKVFQNIVKGSESIVKDVNTINKQTEPPPHFTDASILTAMETAGKLVEKEELREAIKERGLGTPATRAAIIERLIEVGYVNRRGKNLISDKKGQTLVSLLSKMELNELLSPDITGEWEYSLRLIEKGKKDVQIFLEDIKKFTKRIVNKVKKEDIKNVSKQPVGKCPKCGANVYEYRSGYFCVNKDFVLWKKLLGKTISREQAMKLLNGKKILMSNMKSSKGIKFSSYIYLDSKEYQIKFDFSQLTHYNNKNRKEGKYNGYRLSHKRSRKSNNKYRKYRS